MFKIGYVNKKNGLLTWNGTPVKKIIKLMQGFWCQGWFIGIVRYERHPNEPFSYIDGD